MFGKLSKFFGVTALLMGDVVESENGASATKCEDQITLGDGTVYIKDAAFYYPRIIGAGKEHSQITEGQETLVNLLFWSAHSCQGREESIAEPGDRELLNSFELVDSNGEIPKPVCVLIKAMTNGETDKILNAIESSDCMENKEKSSNQALRKNKMVMF